MNDGELKDWLDWVEAPSLCTPKYQALVRCCVMKRTKKSGSSERVVYSKRFWYTSMGMSFACLVVLMVVYAAPGNNKQVSQAHAQEVVGQARVVSENLGVDRVLMSAASAPDLEVVGVGERIEEPKSMAFSSAVAYTTQGKARVQTMRSTELQVHVVPLELVTRSVVSNRDLVKFTTPEGRVMVLSISTRSRLGMANTVGAIKQAGTGVGLVVE